MVTNINNNFEQMFTTACLEKLSPQLGCIKEKQQTQPVCGLLDLQYIPSLPGYLHFKSICQIFCDKMLLNLKQCRSVSLVYQRMTAIPFRLVQFSLESSKLNAIWFGSLLNGQFFVQFHLVQFVLAQTKCIQFGLVWLGPN